MESNAVVVSLTLVGKGLIGGGVNSDFEHLDVEVCNTSADFFFFLLSEVDAMTLESGDSRGST